MDVGCYCVNAIRLLAGEPERVQESRPSARAASTSSLPARFACAEDVVAHFDCGFVLPRPRRARGRGRGGKPRRGRSVARPLARASSSGGEGGDEVDRDDPDRARRTRTGSSSRTSALRSAGDAALLLGREDALGQARTIEALYRSASTGRAGRPTHTYEPRERLMTYVPAPDRYERMQYAAPAAAACCSRRSRSASGTTSATTFPSKRAARSCGAPSTSGSPTSTSPTTTGRRTARPRRTSGACWQLDLHPYRDELVISTKAGYDMWPGPYGEWGSRKYLLASLDQSLGRMGLDYVDIFYSHRFDPETPLEETMGALDAAVRQGKALYVGISSYSAARRPARPRGSCGTSELRADPSARPTRCSTAGSSRSCSTCSAKLGHRLHRLLAARAGDAERQVPGRRSPRAPREPAGDALARPAHARGAREDPGAERDRERRGQTLAQMAVAGCFATRA